jgi:purine-nucleoside phosphorylase
MGESLSLPQFDAAANLIRSMSEYRPEVAIILGSGLGSLTEAVEKRNIIDYHDIPFWPVSTVVGHSGQLVLGVLDPSRASALL